MICSNVPRHQILCTSAILTSATSLRQQHTLTRKPGLSGRICLTSSNGRNVGQCYRSLANGSTRHKTTHTSCFAYLHVLSQALLAPGDVGGPHIRTWTHPLVTSMTWTHCTKGCSDATGQPKLGPTFGCLTCQLVLPSRLSYRLVDPCFAYPIIGYHWAS